MLETLFAHGLGLAQRIGMFGGGGQLFQSVFTTPELVSWNDIVPTSAPVGHGIDVAPAAGGWSCRSAQASVKLDPCCCWTTTFSTVPDGL